MSIVHEKPDGDYMEQTLFHSRASLFPYSNEKREILLKLPFDGDYASGWVAWFSSLCGLNEIHSLKRQWLQLIVAILIGGSGLYFDCLCQIALQVTYRPNDYVLEDIGFQYLPYLKDSHSCDTILSVIAAITMLRFAIFPGPMSMRITILRRWFISSGILFFIRGFSVTSTILPNPEKNCVSDVTSADSLGMMLEALEVGFLRKRTCADVLYSGHTVNITLCLLVWWNYSHLCPLSQKTYFSYPFGKIITTIICLIGYAIIVMSHFHYTVDVWLGFWITFFVWNYYHEVIKSVPFYDSPVFNFLTWMESEASDLHYWRMRGNQVNMYDMVLEKNKDDASPHLEKNMENRERETVPINKDTRLNMNSPQDSYGIANKKETSKS